MTGARVRAAVLVCGLLAVAACGSARRGVPLTGHGEPPTAELQLGQRVFARYCHQCHPGGAGGLGPALNNKPLPGWLIKFQVRNGLGAMPAFPSRVLPGEELNAMVRYLKWLRARRP